MSEQKPGIVCVGEVLVEMRRGADGRFALSCGGDTFNTAVYLARAGVSAAFATALGDDPYSDSILALAAAEGVASDLVLRVPGRLPGVCLIENGPGGERNVRHWRQGAPARELFELPDWMRIAERLELNEVRPSMTTYVDGIVPVLASSVMKMVSRLSFRSVVTVTTALLPCALIVIGCAAVP